LLACDFFGPLFILIVVMDMFAEFAKMFLIILGSIAVVVVIWFVLKKDPEPLLGVYSQPGITSSCVICIILCNCD